MKNVKNLDAISYDDLLKLVFKKIYNLDCEKDFERLDLDNITRIDDGDYQGTILYMIHFKTYQPGEYDYLLTYVGYGSCSVRDILMGINEYDDEERKIKSFVQLGKDIICNTIKPYNEGWRNNSWYDEADFAPVEFN